MITLGELRTGGETMAAGPAADGASDESDGAAVATVSAVALGLVASAQESARGLWARAAAAAEADHVSVSRLMLSAAVSELLTEGESHWAWMDGRWWRCQHNPRSQFGPYVVVVVPDAIYDGRAPDASAVSSRSRYVERETVASLWWDPVLGGGGRRVRDVEAVKALREGERRLAEEMGGPVGSLLPYMTGGTISPAKLRERIAALGGSVGPVRSAQHTTLAGGREDKQYDPRRLGANPPASLVQALGRMHDSALEAYGVPPAVYGSASREAWRLFVSSSVRPTLQLFGEELGRAMALRQPVRMRWAELERYDLQVQARAWDSLRKGGMSADEASRRVGWS